MHASLTAIESSQKLSHSAPADTPTQPVAPWWHTVLVLLPIAIMSVAGAYQHGLPNANLPVMSSRLSGYFTVIVVAVPVASGLIHLLRVHTDSTLATIIPHTVFELVVWLGLSITGGYCEELIFRGYLTRQFSGWTGSRAFGIVLQGVAFGLAHGYYGIAMLAIMVHGWLLGLLAYWRKSLRPGMLAHGLQDTLGGVVAFFAR